MKPGLAAISIGQQIGGIGLLFDVQFREHPAPRARFDGDEWHVPAPARIVPIAAHRREIGCCEPDPAVAPLEAA